MPVDPSFAFTDVPVAPFLTVVTSEIVSMGAFTGAIVVQVSGDGSPEFRICATSACVDGESWQTGSIAAQAPAWIQLRLTSSDIGLTTSTVLVTAASFSTSWHVKTQPAEVIFLGSAVDTTNSSTYSFPNVPLGSPAANRTLFIVVHASTTGAAFQAVGVASTPATRLLAFGENAGSSSPSALYALRYPSGSQGQVTVVVQGQFDRCAIVLYAAFGLASLMPTDTSAVLNAGNGSLSVSVDQGGFVLGAMTAFNTPDTSTAVWMGVDERYDVVIEPTSSRPTLISGGFEMNLGATSNYPVSFLRSPGSSTTRTFIASFR